MGLRDYHSATAREVPVWPFRGERHAQPDSARECLRIQPYLRRKAKHSPHTTDRPTLIRYCRVAQFAKFKRE